MASAASLFKLDLSKYGGYLIVTQGFSSSPSHKAEFSYSLDFRLPAGSKVYALMSGIVRDLRESVKDGANASTSNDNLKDVSNGPSNLGNYVTVQSGGQWLTYQHLQQNSVVPTDEKSVSTGDTLGVVGKTGYREGPHLHVTFGMDDIVMGNFGRGPNSQVADGSTKFARPVFETATGNILPGVVSQISFDLRTASGLEKGQYNLTLIGTKSIDGQGDSNNNVISGNSGKNLLYGRAGEDALYGGDGNDTLIGGAGRDQLMGGAGADVFVLDALSDSGVGMANRDQILDFSRSDKDKIDIGNIDANSVKSGTQDWVFIGNQIFHGKAGELRFSNGVLQGDTNGDKVPDFEIAISGDTPTVSDFFL